jgi:acyl carrier protein
MMKVLTMEDRIKNIAAEVLYVDAASLDIQSSRDDIKNWDSLHHVALVATLEERLNVVVPFEKIAEIRKLADFLIYVKNTESIGE